MVDNQSSASNGTVSLGVKRIKSLFNTRYGDPLPEEWKEWSTSVITASVAGFLFGGLIGSRMSADKYIQMNHNTKFLHQMQAQRELHSASMLGFVGNGMRIGWKVTAFVAVFSGCKILVSIFRDKEDGLNYIAAGAVAGSVYRANWGLKPAVGGMVLGTLLSIPFAGLMYGAHALERAVTGSDKRRSRREVEDLWEQRMRTTQDVISDIEAGADDQPGTGTGRGTGLSTYYTISESNKK